MTLMPASSARRMIRMLSSWSGVPQAPNIIAPSVSGLTWTPVVPSRRYWLMRPPRGGGWTGWPGGGARSACGAGWAFVPVGLAQRGAGVLGAEQAALPQYRDDVVDEVVEPAREVRRHHVE